MTPRLVTLKIDEYHAPVTEEPAELFAACPQKLKMQLGKEPHFRPLVAWRVLASLSLFSPEDIFAAFTAADERTIAFWCRSLAGAGDEKMANYLFALAKEPEEAKVVSFFRKNKTCFEERMLHFVEENIRLFDLPDEVTKTEET